jgi:hypothetical protein
MDNLERAQMGKEALDQIRKALKIFSAKIVATEVPKGDTITLEFTIDEIADFALAGIAAMILGEAADSVMAQRQKEASNERLAGV